MKNFIKPIICLWLVIPLLLPETTAQPFTRVEAETGLDIVRNNNGVAVADYDKDGDLDIYFSGFYSFDPNDEDTWNRLLRNKGDGTFEDVTMAAGFTAQFVNTDVTASMGEKLGVSWGDYDNDGYPDLFLANSRLDQLYHNNGDGTFTDVTDEAGVAGCHSCYSSSGLWFDHDRDGDLDLYVSMLNGPNIFYLNNGDGTFSDMTSFLNIQGDGVVTWSAITLDVGKDGFLDIYCANDTQINDFFANTSGLHYNEASLAYRLAYNGASMGMAIGDYNNDGFFDFYVTSIFNYQPNPLLKNLGVRRFEDVASQMGVENSGWGWGTHFFDYDNDGDEDLAAVTGVVSGQVVNGEVQTDVPNFFFKNMLMEEGTPGFVDWSAASNTNGDERARGLEVFDYDDDGDLDMVVANVESTPYFYKNNTISEGPSTGKNWLKIKLEGTVSNRNAFGTEVKITVDGQSYYRWHQGADFYGQSIKPVHFGLGDAETVDEIQLTWLSGIVDTYQNIQANQTIKITEGGTLTDTKDVEAVELPFKELNSFPNPFSNFTKISFELGKHGSGEFRIFSVLGKEVYRQSFQNTLPGNVEITWDGSGFNGSDSPSGIYFYVLDFEGFRINGKLIKN